MYKFNIFIMSLLLTLSFCYAYAEESREETLIPEHTPYSFLKSGDIVFYYGYDGASSFSIVKDKIYKRTRNFEKEPENKVLRLSFNKLVDGGDVISFCKDKTAVISKEEINYSCKSNPLENCLYSDIKVSNVSKKSLLGKMSLYKIDKNFPIDEKRKVNFKEGSELYSVLIEQELFDFDNFTDFSSLVCTKNDEGRCAGVINNRTLDKVALFELNTGGDNLSNILYKNTDAGITYIFDLDNSKLIPYNTECFNSVKSLYDIRKCKSEEFKEGSITVKKHKTGLIYWVIDYNNEYVDNLFIWVNKRGEPFKAYTNSKQAVNFSFFNKISADVISRLFW